MVCYKCGKVNNDDSKFCADCGTDLTLKVESNAPAEQQIEASLEMKKRKPVFLWIGIIVIVIAAAVAITVLIISKGSAENRYNEKMDLGRKYLEELNYEQAILCFKEAIKIDPKNKEAYKDLTDAYIAWAEDVLDEDPDEAIKILKGAIDELESLRNDDNSDLIDKQIDRLKKRIEEIEAAKGTDLPDDDEYTDMTDEADVSVQPDETDETDETDVTDVTDVPEDPYERLDEGEYEDILELYLKLLENDPENPEIYLVIVEAYLRMGDYDNALYYAQLGYDKTGDERLKEKIDMIMGGNISDSAGRTLKMTWTENGVVIWWHEYTYDSEGRQKTTTVYDADGNQVDYGEYEYDDNGRIIVNVGGYTCDDGMLIRYLNYYDENGRLIRSEHGNNKDFWIDQITEYHYDGNNQWREVIRYAKNGNEVERTHEIDIKDDAGRTIRSERYKVNTDGTKWLLQVNEWEYDENGRRIKYVYSTYNESGEMNDKRIDIYEYDETGKMVRDVTYDTEGNILSERNYQ